MHIRSDFHIAIFNPLLVLQPNHVIYVNIETESIQSVEEDFLPEFG